MESGSAGKQPAQSYTSAGRPIEPGVERARVRVAVRRTAYDVRAATQQQASSYRSRGETKDVLSIADWLTLPSHNESLGGRGGQRMPNARVTIRWRRRSNGGAANDPQDIRPVSSLDIGLLFKGDNSLRRGQCWPGDTT